MSVASPIDAAFDCYRRGRFDEVRSLLEPVAPGDPAAAAAWVLLAQVNILQQRWAAARECARSALELDAKNSGAWFVVGRSHEGSGNLDPALACYRRASMLLPNSPKVQTRMAVACLGLGRREQAVLLLQRVLAAGTEYSPARAKLDELLGPLPGGAAAVNELRDAARRADQEGRLDEALELHHRALRIMPEHPGIWQSAGFLAHRLGNRDASLSCFEKAAQLDASLLPAVEAARRLCISAGLFDKAERYTGRAWALRPSDDLRIAQALTIPAIPPSLEAIAGIRAEYERGLDAALAANWRVTELPAAQGMNGFFLAYHGQNDATLQAKAATVLRDAAPWLEFMAPHCGGALRSPGKIRVGFVSAFFHDHSIGNTSRGLIAQLSRETFEVIGLRLTPSKDDAVTGLIRGSADRWVDLAPDLAAARDQIAALELDILFFQDIGMEPQSYALAFARLAPIQCVSFGHPNTTGIPTVDYFVSNDLYEPPDAASHYTEKLFLLHDLPTLAYYHRPPAPAPAMREAFGLRDEDHLYVCPQMPFKLHPEFDAVLRDILLRDSEGIVVLIRAGFQGYADALQQRFERTLAPVLDRVLFLDAMPYARFLQLLATADVCLDTPHFNGMNTSLETLSVGTPLVTQPGRMQRGRHTQAMYRKMGVLDCIAGTPAHYVDIALRLTSDPEFARSVRSRIREHAPVLFEDPRVVSEFERFFLTAHQAAMSRPAASRRRLSRAREP
jgi:predicted O-linked N-acetylglucosamine transferase (SPINDLY family)